MAQTTNAAAYAAVTMVRPLSHYLSPAVPQLHPAPPTAGPLYPSFDFTRARPPLPASAYSSSSTDSTEKLLLEADMLFNQLAAHGSSRTRPPPSIFILIQNLIDLGLGGGASAS
jgi:hypothetical protein